MAKNVLKYFSGMLPAKNILNIFGGAGVAEYFKIFWGAGVPENVLNYF